jgi:hypothetical protein
MSFLQGTGDNVWSVPLNFVDYVYTIAYKDLCGLSGMNRKT